MSACGPVPSQRSRRLGDGRSRRAIVRLVLYRMRLVLYRMMAGRRPSRKSDFGDPGQFGSVRVAPRGESGQRPRRAGPARGRGRIGSEGGGLNGNRAGASRPGQPLTRTDSFGALRVGGGGAVRPHERTREGVALRAGGGGRGVADSPPRHGVAAGGYGRARIPAAPGGGAGLGDPRGLGLLAVAVPFAVGLAVATPSRGTGAPIPGTVAAPSAPPLAESKLTRLLRGIPITLAVAASFFIVFITVPAQRIASVVRRRVDVHVPLVTDAIAYGVVAQEIEKTLDRHGFTVDAVDPPWWFTTPSRILLGLGGPSFRGYVPERLAYFRGSRLELVLYPNGLLLRGPEQDTARAHGVVVEALSDAPAYQTFDPGAQDIERQIRSVWRRARVLSRAGRLREAVSRTIDKPARVAAEPTIPGKILTAAATAAVTILVKRRPRARRARPAGATQRDERPSPTGGYPASRSLLRALWERRAGSGGGGSSPVRLQRQIPPSQARPPPRGRLDDTAGSSPRPCQREVAGEKAGGAGASAWPVLR
jgi:hypothetical protein